jgi:Glycosyltransferase family 87
MRVFATYTMLVAGVILTVLNVTMAVHHALFLVDFRKAYYAGGDAVLHGGTAGLWPLIQSAEFVNWPIIAYLFVPFAAMGHRGGELAFCMIGIAATTGAYVMLARGCTRRRQLAILLLFLANGPLWYSIVAMGNTTHIILLALIGALALMRKNRMYEAGALIGLSTIIKPMIAIFIVYYVYRRNWRAALAGLAIVAIAATSSLAVFGMDMTRAWYQDCIAAFATRPIGAFNNQSVNAFLLRLWTGPAYLRDWHGHDMPHGVMLSSKILAVCLLVLVARSGWKGRAALRAGRPGDATMADGFDFSLLTAFCIITSPISWSHYYLLLLLPWSLYLSGRLPLRGGLATEATIWASMILCALPVIYPPHLAGTLAAVAARSVASLWLLGGFLLLAALCRGSRFALVPATGNGSSTRPPHHEDVAWQLPV